MQVGSLDTGVGVRRGVEGIPVFTRACDEDWSEKIQNIEGLWFYL